MSERSLSVSSVVEPCAAGFIGLGLGYSVAPRKYSLKRLLLLKEDRFDKIYTQDLQTNLSPREQNALQELRQARQTYRASRKTYADKVKSTAVNWMEKFKQVDVPESLTEAYKTNRENLKVAIAETNYVELNKNYRAAKKALAKSPDDENLKAALTEANTELARGKALIGSKIELYKDSVANIRNERLAKIKNQPVKYTDVKEAYHEFLGALAKRRTAVSNKLFELINDKKLVKDYEILRQFLPKARTKSALSGGLIMAGITTLILKSINKSHSKVA
jgi:hypothetical protein